MKYGFKKGYSCKELKINLIDQCLAQIKPILQRQGIQLPILDIHASFPP